MSRNRNVDRDQKALVYLSQLPKRMLCFHDHDNVADFVLHDLCNERCFNIDKAAYFIDNPDFDCLRGISGYCRHEHGAEHTSGWENPDQFAEQARCSQFNQKVRSIEQHSARRAQCSDQNIVEVISKDLGIDRPKYCAWNMKHDNHGIFIYEACDSHDTPSDDCILSGVCLLSFCPIAQ